MTEYLVDSPVPIYTWAGRPDVAANLNKCISISDVGAPGYCLWISNGVHWKPVNPMSLQRSAVAITNTSSTNSAETNAASILIPGGSMGLSGAVTIEVFATFTGSTNSKNVIVRHNTTAAAVAGGAALMNSTTAVASNIGFRGATSLRNRGIATSQVAPGAQFTVGAGFGSIGAIAGVIDTASDSYLNINFIKTLGTETMTIEWYDVRLIP